MGILKQFWLDEKTVTLLKAVSTAQGVRQSQLANDILFSGLESMQEEAQDLKPNPQRYTAIADIKPVEVEDHYAKLKSDFYIALEKYPDFKKKWEKLKANPTPFNEGEFRTNGVFGVTPPLHLSKEEILRLLAEAGVVWDGGWNEG